jgi:hypothetical protein
MRGSATPDHGHRVLGRAQTGRSSCAPSTTRCWPSRGSAPPALATRPSRRYSIAIQNILWKQPSDRSSLTGSCGEPGALKGARRVRETDRENRTATTTVIASRADFHRPAPPLICGFIDRMRARGFRVESICRVLSEQVCRSPHAHTATRRPPPVGAHPRRCPSDRRAAGHYRHCRGYLRLAQDDRVSASPRPPGGGVHGGSAEAR